MQAAAGSSMAFTDLVCLAREVAETPKRMPDGAVQGGNRAPQIPSLG